MIFQFLLLPFITLATLGGVIYLGFMLKRRTEKLTQEISSLRDQIWEPLALAHLLPEYRVAHRPSSWAANVDLLAEISRWIDEHQPNVVVELGSGISTLVIASALKRNDCGRLISIDHDDSYAALTQEMLRSSRLHEVVDLRVSPLEPQQIDDKNTIWYRLGATSDIGQIDLLFVDGPPGATVKHARRPALSVFWDRINCGGAIFFDDAAREQESKFIADWAEKNPSAIVRWLPLRKGCAIVQKPL